MLVVLLCALGSPASAATFSVTSTADAPDAAVGDGVCATAGGACTLRAAVEEANAQSGIDVVVETAGLPPALGDIPARCSSG